MQLKNRTLLLIGMSLIALLTLPSLFVDKMRGRAVSTFSSLWESLGSSSAHEEQIKGLELENQLLKNEIVYLKELVDVEKKVPSSIPAKVIFRPINAWNSSFWIDKGERDNQVQNQCVIGKNSPVVVGTVVVGVVDFVGERQSRVRLITDAHLNLSVRIKRGSLLLAKGELVGKSSSHLRSHRPLLKGVGFNYDFADENGPARDLRTGDLIQVNDLLVTTGMDGVFPPNLEVAVVKAIPPLKEGDYSYSLEAESLLKNFNSIMLVFILPPL